MADGLPGDPRSRIRQDAVVVSVSLLHGDNLAEMLGHVRHSRSGVVYESDGALFVSGGSSSRSAFTNAAYRTDPALEPESFISAARRFFRGRAATYSIWSDESADHDLGGYLDGVGLQRRRSSGAPGMILEAEPVRVGPRCDIRTVATEEDRVAFVQAVSRSYGQNGEDDDELPHRFATLSAVRGPRVQALYALDDGVPVAGGVLVRSPGVAGVGWVGTVPEARGQGFGTAVTAAIVRSGFATGASLASLQSSPDGEPVYTAMGFRTLTRWHVFDDHPDSSLA